jgi:AcrR family transcriptional regulator
MSLSDSRPYHHGDLRRALISAAHDLLEVEGPDALSLRAVAREAGVSPAAPYHHFKDKGELLAAVADQGFADLGEDLRKILEGTASPADRIGAMGAAYVSFAVRRRPLYRVMIATSRTRDQPPAPGSTHSDVVGLMRSVIAETSGPGATDEDIDLANMAAWAFIHGLADLTTFRILEPVIIRLGGGDAFTRAVMEHLRVIVVRPPG